MVSDNNDFKRVRSEKPTKALMRPTKARQLKVIAGAPEKPLIIGDIKIACYVLEDETRVLTQRGMVAGLGLRSGGGSSGTATKVPRFFNSKILKSFIPDDLMMLLNSPVVFSTPQGGKAFGYPATVLPDVCEVVLSVRDEGKLLKSQLHIAAQCDLIMRGLARVGIIALVDEVTGYQELRSKKALADILESYLGERRAWVKTFPLDFYKELFRLRRWKWKDLPDGKKPLTSRVVGKFTKKLIYERMVPGFPHELVKELEKLNPITQSGMRASKHHQWFSEGDGLPRLREHITATIAIMRVSSDWGVFSRNLKKAFPHSGDQGELLDD